MKNKDFFVSGVDKLLFSGDTVGVGLPMTALEGAGG
jgi:hypothetical protein